MPRSIRDELKRDVAQSTQHLAYAVLAVEDVRQAFAKAGKPEAEILEQIQINIAQQREYLLAFALKAWELDEEHLMSYL